MLFEVHWIDPDFSLLAQMPSHLFLKVFDHHVEGTVFLLGRRSIVAAGMYVLCTQVPGSASKTRHHLFYFNIEPAST
jgi:hypothetical protein